MRVTRSLLLLVLAGVAAAACGGGGTEPTPPRDTSPLTVQLTTPSALVFLDHKVPVQAFVLRALDTAGRVVDGAVFHVLSAPTGFTLHGDTLVAPHTEAAGMLRVTATRPQALGARAAVPLAAGDSTATDSLLVTAAIDLSAYHWRAAWSCTGGFANYDSVGRADSAVFDGSVTAWQYPGDSLYLANWDGVAQMAWDGTRRLYVGGSLARTDSVHLTPVSVFRQAPDTLVYYNPTAPYNPATGNGQWPAPLTSAAGAPRVYVGGNWCEDATQHVLTPPTLEEVPAAP